MRAQITVLAFLTAVGLAGAAHAADCTRPPEPSVPDGTTASQAEMVKAKEAVQSYIQETESFLKCVRDAEENAVEEVEASGEDLSEEDKKAKVAETKNNYIKRYNAAVDSMKSVAQNFNTSLRAFLDRQEASDSGSGSNGE